MPAPDPSNNMTNSTAADTDFLMWDPFVYGLFSALTCAGSGIVFYLFAKTSQLRSITGYLMLCITTVDTGTMAFILLPSIYTTVASEVPWNGTVICSVQAYSNMFLQNFKANLIMLCAVDRLFSLLKPFLYQRIATLARLALCIVFILAFSAVMPVILWPIMGWEGEAPSGSPLCWPMVQDESAFYVYWVSIILDLFIPGVIVVVCYGIIVGIVVKQRQNIDQHQKYIRQIANTRQSDANAQQIEDKRGSLSQRGQQTINFIQHLAACKMLFIVTLLYFLSHVPIFIADHFFYDNFALLTICNYLAYFSTWTNFCIYYKTDSVFKAATRRIFQCKRNLENSSRFDTYVDTLV